MSALSNILVLDHTTALAGPYCTQMLGDLGAEVIKIERAGVGDASRAWGPPFVNGESAYFLGVNRNKRSLSLNLANPAEREIFHKLVARADVLVQNVPRQDSRVKLGLDYETCQTINPRLVWASITGYGNSSGPYSEKPGYDVAIQGMAGTMALTGAPDSEPMRFPTPIADITTGLYTALAIVSALFTREHTGKGQMIDNALLDCQVTWLANMASSYLIAGTPFRKLGNTHPSIVPYQPFPTADRPIIIAGGTEEHWQKLTQVLGLPELANDPRFAHNPDRLQNKAELIPLLTARLQEKSALEWVEALEIAGIPNGLVNTPEDILADLHLEAREMIVEMEHPTVGKIRTLGNPMKLSDTPVSYRRPAPTLGQHTQEILQELENGQLGTNDA
ncbi:MAG TPA: CoA transferase [Anaerolineales bacterium]|nr:CoA transferase [Anaerolineales bacterium]